MSDRPDNDVGPDGKCPMTGVTGAELRALATRLDDRHAGPSLDGYSMVDGLRAAADLLDGAPGPLVHADLAHGSDAFPPRVPLRSLLRAE